jgi:hypothetical protein
MAKTPRPTCLNGRLSGTASGADFVPPKAFGSGGSLAMPYWYGNKHAAGDVAEIIVLDRQLGDEERAAVERYLAGRYRSAAVPAWRMTVPSVAR